MSISNRECTVGTLKIKMREWNMQEWKMRHDVAGVENEGVEFAALNGYGKLLQNLKLTQRRYTTQYGDRLHCSAFDGENVKAAEQLKSHNAR